MTAGEPMAKTIPPQFKVTDPANYELSFQSDAVLPAQFFHQRQGSGAVKPFTRLLYAILIDAMRRYQVNFDARRPSKKQQFSEARGWLFHDEHNGPFSFRKVCDELGMDPHHVRRGLIGWKAKKLAGEKVGAIRRSPVFVTRGSSQLRSSEPRRDFAGQSGKKRGHHDVSESPRPSRERVFDVFGRGTAS
jgi:hypothetical protein